jgi:hypothetical protein
MSRIYRNRIRIALPSDSGSTKMMQFNQRISLFYKYDASEFMPAFGFF